VPAAEVAAQAVSAVTVTSALSPLGILLIGLGIVMLAGGGVMILKGVRVTQKSGGQASGAPVEVPRVSSPEDESAAVRKVLITQRERCRKALSDYCEKVYGLARQAVEKELAKAGEKIA
jgi:hypothetical protein